MLQGRAKRASARCTVMRVGVLLKIGHVLERLFLRVALPSLIMTRLKC